MNDQRKGVLLTSIGVLAIVPDSLLIRLMEADTATIIFWRALISASVVSVVVLLTYKGKTLKTITAMGKGGVQYVIFMAVGTSFFITAIQTTSVASALFIVSTSPVFAALISRIFLGERISRRMFWTILFTLIGIGVIAYGATDPSQATTFTGVFAALGAALFLASCFTAARSAKHVSMVPASALAYFLTAAVLAALGLPKMLVGADWTYILILSCVFVPLGTSLMALGPRYITSAEVSLLLLLEAVLAPILIWAVLGENPGKWALIGGAIVLGVLMVSNLIGLRRAKTRLSGL